MSGLEGSEFESGSEMEDVVGMEDVVTDGDGRRGGGVEGTGSGAGTGQRNLEERLKSALWFHIGKIVDSETISLGVNATPQFIGSLTELVWTQIESTSQDLESFAKHGKRSTIQTDDVLLLARRNDGLDTVLRAFIERRLKAREDEEATTAGKRGGGGGGGQRGSGRGRGMGRGRGVGAAASGSTSGRGRAKGRSS